MGSVDLETLETIATIGKYALTIIGAIIGIVGAL